MSMFEVHIELIDVSELQHLNCRVLGCCVENLYVYHWVHNVQLPTYADNMALPPFARR